MQAMLTICLLLGTRIDHQGRMTICRQERKREGERENVQYLKNAIRIEYLRGRRRGFLPFRVVLRSTLRKWNVSNVKRHRHSKVILSSNGDTPEVPADC